MGQPVINRMLPTPQAAAYLGVDAVSLRDNWRDWGLTPSKYGRTLKFRLSDLDAFIARRTVRAAS